MSPPRILTIPRRTPCFAFIRRRPLYLELRYEIPKEVAATIAVRNRYYF
ncbi:hypothetical protein ACVRXF_00925 [Streptococcus orisasini]